VREEFRQGGVRFSLAFNGKGEIVLHWTNESGRRVFRILSGNRGKKPSRANVERMSNFRRWLFDTRQSMESDTQQNE
ncbi:hypothetical protein ACXLTH_004238, partial [Salmonella enterica subsp. enterica serovar Kiambu]